MTNAIKSNRSIGLANGVTAPRNRLPLTSLTLLRKHKKPTPPPQHHTQPRA